MKDVENYMVRNLKSFMEEKEIEQFECCECEEFAPIHDARKISLSEWACCEECEMKYRVWLLRRKEKNFIQDLVATEHNCKLFNGTN